MSSKNKSQGVKRKYNELDLKKKIELIKYLENHSQRALTLILNSKCILYILSIWKRKNNQKSLISFIIDITIWIINKWTINFISLNTWSTLIIRAVFLSPKVLRLSRFYCGKKIYKFWINPLSASKVRGTILIKYKIKFNQ